MMQQKQLSSELCSLHKGPLCSSSLCFDPSFCELVNSIYGALSLCLTLLSTCLPWGDRMSQPIPCDSSPCWSPQFCYLFPVHSPSLLLKNCRDYNYASRYCVLYHQSDSFALSVLLCLIAEWDSSCGNNFASHSLAQTPKRIKNMPSDCQCI